MPITSIPPIVGTHPLIFPAANFTDEPTIFTLPFGAAPLELVGAQRRAAHVRRSYTWGTGRANQLGLLHEGMPTNADTGTSIR